jgi:cyclase
MPSRREFCAMLSTLAAATLIPRRTLLARFQARSLSWVELRPNAWLIGEGGGNCLLIRTPDGPILCDSKLAGVADELRDLVAEQTGSMPKLLINTHHHADHTGGNFIVGENAKIIAHRNLAPRLKDTIDSRIAPGLRRRAQQLRDAGRDEAASALEKRIEALKVADFAADVEFEDEHEVTFGGVRIELRHYGRGHTDNDIVMIVPEWNILHMGDLIFHELHPFIDRGARATTRGWQQCLAEAKKLCNEQTLVIPGHGKTTDRSGLDQMSAYFDTLRAFVKAQIDAGKSRDQITAMNVDAFAGRGFERMQPVALGVVYEELMEGKAES